MAKNKICAIDASTNSLAFAIFDDKKLIACGKINFEGKDAYSKVGDAARKCLDFFKKFEIDAIVIEHTVFINSPKTAADLALVQGAILGTAMINGINKVGSVSPITWQMYLGNPKLSKQELFDLKKANPGKSDSWLKNYSREFRKQRTINIVNIAYDKNIKDNDIADAIGIGHWAVHNIGRS